VLWLVILGVAAVNMVARLQSEECLLTRELGEEYVRYRSRTGMLIPWLL
jgi:protein-S-isoprenylcysteine O-methyltransferase Ste14